ncbi:MAG: hypothetical protein K6G76_03435 [Lachnospiraceae bacterium]|nr:hypothetical protein [Lachnospiraceae bacterium]
MDKVRIGVYDKELSYVTRLSVFMNKDGKSRWKVSGYTEKNIVKESLEKNKLDLIVSTDKEELLSIKENYPQLNCIYLSSEESKRYAEGGISLVFRYQNARVICEEIRKVVESLGMLAVKNKTCVVVYSPVSRCGKTTLLLDVISGIGGWLYVGMEDYGYLKDVDNDSADDFFYYVKERKADKVTEILQMSNGVVPSPFSFFDTRGLNRNDLEWFFEVFEKIPGYRGVVFDMGLGVMTDFSMLSAFDKVVVPYINDEISFGKKGHFEKVLRVCDMEDMLERIYFLDMKNEPHAYIRRLME